MHSRIRLPRQTVAGLCRPLPRSVLCVNVLSVIAVMCVSGALSAEIPAQRAGQIEDAAPSSAPADPKKHRRVLIFLTPPHLMQKDPHKGYCIPYGTHAFQTLGQKTGAYEPVVSDDLAMFLPERISQFDAIILNNTSGAWIIPTQQQIEQEPFRRHGSDIDEVETVLRDSLLNYVRSGGGLVGIHYASGGNRHWPEFSELLGASFDGHPWNEEVGFKLDEPEHPLVAAFKGKNFRLADEIYQFKAPYSRDHVRVLLSLDTANTNMGVKWIRREDNDFAQAWIRGEGDGRVFFCALGHRTELYWNPALLKFYLAGIQFCTGDLDAPAKPVGNSAVSDSKLEDGFISLFNGTDLSGWKGDPEIWSVQDGVITGETTSSTQLQANNFLTWQGGQPADFELRLEYKLIGGNSGVYFHAEPRTEGDLLVGPQADFSADHRWTGVLMEWKKRDVLAERGEKVEIDQNGKRRVVGSVGDPKELLGKVRDRDWNEYTIITRGGRTVLQINGVTMCEVIDRDPRRTPQGHLALQVHRGPPMRVQFRNICLRESP